MALPGRGATEEVRRQHLWRPVAEIEVNNVFSGGGNDALHRVTCSMHRLFLVGHVHYSRRMYIRREGFKEGFYIRMMVLLYRGTVCPLILKYNSIFFVLSKIARGVVCKCGINNA